MAWAFFEGILIPDGLGPAVFRLARSIERLNRFGQGCWAFRSLPYTFDDSAEAVKLSHHRPTDLAVLYRR